MAVKTVICFYLFCLWLQVQAQQGPVLTSSSREPCFGQTVTLTCTHPDPFQDLVKYVPQVISFIENGQVLNFAIPDNTTRRFAFTRLSSTASTISFTVTEDYHANRVIDCSCFLTLTDDGREESNTINMDVNETIQSPIIMSKPDGTSGLLQWNSSSSNCNNYQYMFTLTWVRVTVENSSTGTVSTEKNRYDFTGMPGGEYTVSLKPRVTNFNLNESEPVHDCWITIIQPPTIVSKPNSTSGLLHWRPSSNCSNYQYIFTLTWVRIGDGSTGTVSTVGNRYDFTGMPGGNYTASITAKIVGLNLDKSEPLSVPPFTTPPAVSLLPGGATVVIVIVIVVVIVIVAIIAIAIIVVICCCRNKKKRVSQSCSPVTESEYSEAPNKKQEAENVELGQTRQELDKKQEAENDQVQYAAIDFSGQRPIAPPPLETVVYTQTVEQFRNARKNRPIPPLPPAKTEEEEEEERKLAQEAAEITADFKAQVVAIFQASKLVYRTLDPEEPVVGTYQKKTFVASFVHAPGGKEILSSEVEAIIKARQLQSTDKGFLVATTDSISGPWLEYLEKHNCHFIGLSRKGGVKKEMLLKKLSLCFPESSSF